MSLSDGFSSWILMLSLNLTSHSRPLKFMVKMPESISFLFPSKNYKYSFLVVLNNVYQFEEICPMLRNTRLIMISNFTNISGQTETTRILIDVTFHTRLYLVFEIEKTAYRKLISENYIYINLGIDWFKNLLFRDIWFQNCWLKN